jgi:DNA polymerase-3 subunit delta'
MAVMNEQSIGEVNTLLPWHQPLWAQLWSARQQQRLAHALLLIGIDGIGKQYFAEQLAQAVLCQQPTSNGFACRECHACHMIQAKSHPDFITIVPEKAGQKIAVDQIREIISLAYATTLLGGYRVIIVSPATSMNTNAANALLKLLEEPPTNTLFILLSNKALRMPATIVSRCQKVVFAKPEKHIALTWLNQQITNQKVDAHLLLKLADGAPLKALAMLEQDLLTLRNNVYQGLHSISQGIVDPLALATQLHTMDQLSVVDLLLSWLTDLLRYKLTEDPTQLVNADYRHEILAISVKLLKSNLLAYMDDLQQTRGDLLISTSLNKQLVVEDLLIKWTNYVSS